MQENKELRDEELESVNGGYQTDTSAMRGKVGEHIGADKVRNYVGHLVFIIADDSRCNWVKGRLIASYDYEDGCSDVILHEIDITDLNFWGDLHDYDGNCISTGERRKFNSEEVTVYLCEDEG